MDAEKVKKFLVAMGEYPYPTLWMSMLTTILIVLAFSLAVSANERAIEKHIDATIATTVQQANEGPQAKAAQRLFDQVNSICKQLSLENAQVHCG